MASPCCISNNSACSVVSRVAQWKRAGPITQRSGVGAASTNGTTQVSPYQLVNNRQGKRPQPQSKPPVNETGGPIESYCSQLLFRIVTRTYKWYWGPSCEGLQGAGKKVSEENKVPRRGLNGAEEGYLLEIFACYPTLEERPAFKIV
ncbi:hypothetical protein CEXT_720191 [Caerostris extrusa]|uniref:Uncharacterized protein n=1 Tax=Caerostris extrusa TaxID=172846 RepID=A0AAV4T241_CAEEX|nr:hypothetical protein CEXT_720191 [Caerostris extrusa]